MALPDLIEIVPLAGPVIANVTVPGSKSITNRALILAALDEGEVTLTGALWSEDTQIMVGALQSLGFAVEVEQDPGESQITFFAQVVEYGPGRGNGRCRSCTGHGEGGIAPPGPIKILEQLVFMQALLRAVGDHRGPLGAVAILVDVRGDGRDTRDAEVEGGDFDAEFFEEGQNKAAQA